MTVWKMALAIVLAVVILFLGSAMLAGILEGVQTRWPSSPSPKASMHQTLFDLDAKKRPAAFLDAFFSEDTCREISEVSFDHMDAASTAYWRVRCANNNRVYRVTIAADNHPTVVNCAELTNCF